MKHVLSIFAILLAPFFYGIALAAEPVIFSQSSLKATYEEFKLPGNESMGMLGMGVDYSLNSYFKLGIASYTAVRGERGGFITLGGSASFNYPFTEGLELDSGLFVGAGGGHGGNTLSGGGLMVRVHLGANYEVGKYGKLGLGVSSVDFPNGGAIHSTQPYFSYTLPFSTLTAPGWSAAGPKYLTSAEEKRLSPALHEFALSLRKIAVASRARTDSGKPQADFNLLGVEWRTYLNNHVFAKLETEGAAGGHSAGYMHILAGVGVRYPLVSDLYATVSVAAGGGGGGDVNTGGGFLVDSALGLQYFITKQAYVDVSGSYLKAPSASFEAKGIGIKLGYQFGSSGKMEIARDEPSRFDPVFLRVRLASQTYFNASKSSPPYSSSNNIDNLGVQLDCFINKNFFVTGQGFAAYGGNAGAYMAGFAGGGYHLFLGDRLFAEVEGLAGAAGGGGVSTGGGMVTQANASLGYTFSDTIALLATLGKITSVNGALSSTVAGVSLVFRGMAYSK